MDTSSIPHNGRVAGNKEEMRAAFRARRREAAARAATTGPLLAERVLALPEVVSAVAHSAVIGCYLSLPQEPSTIELRALLRAAGARVVVPRVRDSSAMDWCEDVPDDNPVAGIPVPSGAEVHESPDLLVVPALAIDEQGYRLGQGGGYYDRVQLDVPRIALIFDEEVVPLVPREDHDLRVDVAVTPTRTVRFAAPR